MVGSSSNQNGAITTDVHTPEASATMELPLSVLSDPLTCDHTGSPAMDEQSPEPKGDDITLNFNDQITDHSALPCDGDNHMLNHMSAPYRRLLHPADKSLLFSFFASLFHGVAALVLFVPAIVFIIVLLPIGFIGKRCSACCSAGKSKCLRRTTLLTPTEEVWLHDTSFNQMLVQSLITIEHGLDFSHLCDLIYTRLICAESKSGKRLYPRFTQKLVKLNSGYAWVDHAEFCIVNHVLHMPKTVCAQSDVRDYVASMAVQELSHGKPLWEMHVLTDFGEHKDMLILFRMHPCLSDGISVLKVLVQSITDNPSVYRLKPRFGHMSFAFNFIRSILVGPSLFLGKWIFTKADYNLLHGPSLSGEKVVAWSKPFSLERATQIKQVTRCKLNDVLLSVTAGSMRKYFQTSGVGNPYNMLASVPIDLRSDHATVAMGNKYALVNILLPTNTEGAIPRLWDIRQRMDKLKSSPDTVLLYINQWILSYMLPKCLFANIWACLLNKATCLVSSLPGPEKVLHVTSKQVKNIVYWMPTSTKVAVSVSFFTYAGQVQMAVIADKAVMPQPHILTDNFVVQMENLSELLAHRRVPGQHRAGRRTDVFINLHSSKALSHKEPSLKQIQCRLTRVQQELQDLNRRLHEEGLGDGQGEGEGQGEGDMEGEREGDRHQAVHSRALEDEIDRLKEEFTDLISTLRKRRIAEGQNVLSDEVQDDELQLSYRRRTFSTPSHQTVVSTVSLGRATSPALPHHMSPGHRRRHSQNALSSPAFLVGHSHGGATSGKWKKYHTFHCTNPPRGHTPAPSPVTMATQGNTHPPICIPMVSITTADAIDRECEEGRTSENTHSYDTTIPQQQSGPPTEVIKETHYDVSPS